MAGEKVGGVAYCKMGATQITLAGGVTLSPSMTEREEIAGPDGSVNYTEKPRAPGFTIDVAMDSNFSAAALEAITSTTIELELAQTTYTFRDAWVKTPIEADAITGVASVEVMATSVNER